MLQPIKRCGRWLRKHKDWRAHFTFAFGGTVVGLLAVFMAWSSEWANELFLTGVEHYSWMPFVVSPLGLILVLWLTRKYFPGSEGSGIPQVMASLEHAEQRGALLSLRIAFGKIFLCILGLLSGASIGREGPTVHVGAAVMYSLRGWISMRRYDIDRVLILTGGAAGVSAAFNTPLAGIVFAIEELSRSFEVHTRALMLTGVMAASIMALGIQGNYTYFGQTSALIELQEAIVPVLICGVIGGILGGLFSLLLIRGNRWVAPIRLKKPYLVAGVCGLGIAVVGYFSGHLTYGTGYLEATHLVTNDDSLGAEFALMKFLATVISYLSGIPGGIFAPSLATGAGVGALIADWLSMYPHGALVLFGMVAYFSGVVQAPITAFVIVMEMTDKHELILPLMVAAFIGTAFSKMICHTPIYSTLADNFLPEGKKFHS
ncbi:MAG: chloride channel protein [Gammaproteobacteria bacterium]|nr:chloride channel protein [Gammaproteobacteria bacterium]